MKQGLDNWEFLCVVTGQDRVVLGKIDHPNMTQHRLCGDLASPSPNTTLLWLKKAHTRSIQLLLVYVAQCIDLTITLLSRETILALECEQ